MSTQGTTASPRAQLDFHCLAEDCSGVVGAEALALVNLLPAGTACVCTGRSLAARTFAVLLRLNPCQQVAAELVRVSRLAALSGGIRRLASTGRQ